MRQSTQLAVGALVLLLCGTANAGRFSKYKTCESCVGDGFGWSLKGELPCAMIGIILYTATR